MSQVVIGFDPGITGGVASLVNGELASADDMPTTARKSGGNAISVALLRDLVLSIMAQTPGAYFVAAIEDVHSMPGQGVKSVFGFGRSLGNIEAVAQCLSIPIEWVTPQAWKRTAGLIGTDKDMARTKVIATFPRQASLFARKKDIGRADAVLIAHHVFKTKL